MRSSGLMVLSMFWVLLSCLLFFFLLVFFFGQIDDLIQRFSLGKVLGFDVRNEED